MLGSPFGPRGRPLHALQPLRTLVHPLFIRFGGSAEEANTPNEECLFEHQNGASRPRERRDDFSRFQAWLKPCLGSLEQGTGLECLWTLWRARIQRPNRFEQIEHRTANRSRVGHEIQNARSPRTQELERALKVQQQELRMREAALPALAEDVALLDDASQRLAERRA